MGYCGRESLCASCESLPLDNGDSMLRGKKKKSSGDGDVRGGASDGARGGASDNVRGGAAARRGRSATPRVNFDQAGERLQKILAAAGVASRRESEQLIVEGRVEVDGQTVTELGTRVDRQSQEIRVDGEPLPRPKLVYFAVHKPEGVVCTASDPSGRTRVTDLLPPDIGRVFAVGRLDLASEGLILVTNDGELANQLTHPRHGVEKTYEVKVAGHPEQEVLAQVRRGVHLAEGFARAANVKIKSRRKNGTILEMVLDEGRNREIRRLLASVGHRVQRLTRIAVGPIRLGDLPRGAVRPLSPVEVRKLRTYIRESERNSRKKPARAASRTETFASRDRKRKAAAGKAIFTGCNKRKSSTKGHRPGGGRKGGGR